MRKVCAVTFALCLGTLLLVFSDTVKSAAVDALRLWGLQLVPVLFPFFICADMLRRLQDGRLSAPLMFIMSMLAGAPAGARLCSDAASNIRARTDTVAALNMISPMFVLSAYCRDMLGLPFLALPILLSQYISALIMFLLSDRSALSYAIKAPEHKHKNFFMLLSSGIYDAVCAMLSIGGTIVFFKVMIALLGRLYCLCGLPPAPPLLYALAAGSLEFVNGCSLLSRCALGARSAATFSSFIFSFGGLCVMAQSMRFCEIQPRRYIERKLLQGVIAALLAYCICPLTLRAEQSVFLSLDLALIKRNTFSALGILVSSSLSLSALCIIQFALQRKKRTASQKNCEAVRK